jgi:polyphosphate:AMP phosphotransferase
MSEILSVKKNDHAYSEQSTKTLGIELARLQRGLLATQFSLLILVDGWGASGKGRLIRDIVHELDPRYYEVRVIEEETEYETSHPTLWRFWRQIPPYGRIAVLNRSWYSEIFNDRSLSDKEVKERVRSLERFEQALEDDGMAVVKFFLQHSHKTMKENIDAMRQDPDRNFLLSARDESQLHYYDDHRRRIEDVLEMNRESGYPWVVIPSKKRKPDSKLALGVIIEKLRKKMTTLKERTGKARPELKTFPVSKLDLTPFVNEEEYNARLKTLQKQAGDLLFDLYTRDRSIVLVFEGTDAAGKGGAIKRLVREMDPRGYDIATTAAPDATERRYHYLWRFYRDFPQKGYMTLFDRSWYGRVLVERIEGFTSEDRWSEAYDEINAMEQNLTSEGMVILKFLIIIDKEEQGKRFLERAENPDKTYKLTDEDWRNREKFDIYLEAFDEMVERTDTPYAPWIVVSGTDKRYARLAVLEAFINHVKKELKS